MRKLRTLEIAKAGTWGKDGATITKQDLAEVKETFQGKRPVVIGHDGAADDKAPKFGDVLDLRLSEDGTVLKGDVAFLEAAEGLYADGYYDGWSVSIPRRGSDGKRYLHHLAILGATPPKIPGLRELAAVGIDYADGEKKEIFGFSGKIPEEVEEVDPKELQAKYDELLAKFTAAEEELKKLKAGGGGAGGDGKEKEFSDELKKVRADLVKSRVDAFLGRIEGKIPAGLKGKATALAGRIGDGEDFEFSDGDKKATGRPLELLGDILSAWPAAVQLGPSGNDYSDAKGSDGKPIDWAALAAKA